MPKRIKTNFLYKLYLNIISSIALVPAIILVVLFALSLFTLYVDQESPGLVISKAASIDDIISPDSARSLLSTIASGMITLMVFSFTMVMVVLNQTASNYSPRVLSTLIRGRFHQFVMGFYLGTIAYSFMVLSCIQSEAYEFDVPVLSIIITAILSLSCLVLFVIFIQSISFDIQIGNIINKIYKDTLKSLDHELNKKRCLHAAELPDTNQWEIVYSPISGYLDEIDHSLLVKKTQHMDVSIKLLFAVGRFLNRKDAFFCVSRRLSDSEQEEIFHAFVFRHQEIVQQNYVYGFKQLTEIAVKALSPAINDPGTAIQAIDRLTDLFVNSMVLSGTPVLQDKEKKIRVIYHPVAFEDIFYFSFSSIKNYTRNDMPVVLKLMQIIKTIAQNDKEAMLTNLLLASVNDTIEQFAPELRSASDKKRFKQSIEEFSVLYADRPGMEEVLKQLTFL